jgi:uncharacterized protein YcfJ
MKKTLMMIPLISASLFLAGCSTTPDGRVQSAGCDTGTNYGAAAVGALGGAAVGSLIGSGTGNALAIGAGAVAGGVAGSKSRVGCRDYR